MSINKMPSFLVLTTHNLPEAYFLVDFLPLTVAVAPVIVALSAPLLAAEGGLSNYIPAFYGDLALATQPRVSVSVLRGSWSRRAASCR